MVVNVTERTTTYISRIEKLAKQENMSLDDALAFLISKLVNALSARLDNPDLTQQEKLEIFDTVVALTPSGEELGLDEQQLLAEIDAERGEFIKEYFGIDLTEYAESNS